MARLCVEQISDWDEYTGGPELRQILDPRDALSRVRLGPGARHVHVLRVEPEVGLATFDKRPQLPLDHGRSELTSRRDAPVVDVLSLGGGDPAASSAAAVVYQDGKAEFWRFGSGWRLLQTSELCNSPRARIVSVCASSHLIVWCEERPPSGGSSRNTLRYCVCRRGFEVEDGAVSLRGVKVILHNNPRFAVVASGESVHLLPDLTARPAWSVPGFILTWSPRHDTFAVSTLCQNTPLKRLSAKESDFKKLVTDCLGFLSTLSPPEVYDYAPTSPGGLLLLFNTGGVSLLREDGVMRQLCAVADDRLMTRGTHTSLCLYEETLALTIGQDLHLVDVACGRELEKVALKGEGLLYVNHARRGAPHLVSKNGLFAVASKEAASRDNPKSKHSCFTAAERFRPGAPLIEAVFEEACKYYQQRSLSSTRLTADMLKRGGMFQAPIALASILGNYLSRAWRQRGAAPPQNGDVGLTPGQAKLMSSLEAELEALVSLEEVKSSLVKANAKEAEALCESLVEKEVARLLSSPGPDGEALLYLNYIFDAFPRQVWNAAQAALQLSRNGEGSLSSRAPPDVWKTVLTPAAAPGANAAPVSNGRPENARRHKSEPRPAPPAALPVFELLCRSVFHFQPGWLPRFLELAQEQQGSAGLGLSLASSSWSFPRGRDGGEGGGGGGGDAPLYKRALAVVSGLSRDRGRQQELEVELLLVSGRPNAVLQALRILMAKQQWERVMGVAREFCSRSPLLNKEIFSTLLCEVTQHRDLDPYLDLLWALCPDDLTVTTVLNLVLKNLGSPAAPPPSPLSPPPSFSASAGGSSRPAPFAGPRGSQLTVGLLKPLLRKVLQREAKPSQHYADILQSPSFPPPAPPRQPAERPGTAARPGADLSPPLETPEQQSSAHACPTSAC